MELPVIIAILAVVAVILFVSGVFKGGKKQSHSEAAGATASKAGHASAAAAGTSSAASSSAAAAGEKEKKGKKKNRSNKTKAQKAKARALAAAIAAAQSASEAERTEPESEQQRDETDSDSDSSDSSDDEVQSGVRFQVQAKLQAEKQKAQRAAMLAKEKQLNAPRQPKSAIKQVEAPVAEKPHGSDGDNDDDDDIVETPVTKITNAAHFDGWAVVEDKRKNKTKKAESEEPAPSPTSASAPSPVPAVESEVAAAAAAAAAAAPAAPAAPVVESVTTELKVDAKKVGLLIGPKGATKIQIQTLTGTTIAMPKADKESTEPVTISVTGPALGVSKAVTALNDLCTKGYATLLEAEDFQESYVAVHPNYLPDIIGKAGANIRALQQHTSVRITIPANPKGPGPDGKVIKTKIGLAGRKEKVSQARALIKDMCKYYHTPVTHPGVVHAEMELDSKYFNFIIGAKGSEIKNIQNTHKVQVHIPDADSVNPNLVIVGSEASVENARKHIEKIVARVDGAAEAAALAAAGSGAAAALVTPNLTSSLVGEGAASPAATTGGVSGSVSPKPAASSTPLTTGWATKSRIPTAPKPEEVPVPGPEDAWMNEFAPPTGGINLSAMLPATAKFAPHPILPAAPAAATTTVSSTAAAPLPAPVEAPKKAPGAAPSAWNNLSSLPAEKW